MRLRVHAARAGGTAALTAFVLYQRSRYINTADGAATSALVDLNTSTVTRNFSGTNNSERYTFQIDMTIRTFSADETRLIQLQRLGTDAADTLDTSLIIYQIDLYQL